MRLSPIERHDLNDEQRPVLEAIESGPRGKGRPGIGMIGPFGAWVRAPSVGQAIQGAGEAIRVQHITRAERSGSRHLHCAEQ